MLYALLIYLVHYQYPKLEHKLQEHRERTACKTSFPTMKEERKEVVEEKVKC